MKAFAIVIVVAGAVAAPAMAQRPQIPGYIRAKADPIAKAYGAEVAQRVFSGAFTPIRQSKVIASLKDVPGLTCPPNPRVLLFNVIPYRIKAGLVSWIEQYLVGCEREIRRSLLMVIDNGKVEAIELLRGATITDPLLQRDAKPFVLALAKAKAAPDCEAVNVYDSNITQKPDGGHWMERWNISTCGGVVNVDVTFLPSPRGGTTWSAKLAP